MICGADKFPKRKHINQKISKTSRNKNCWFYLSPQVFYSSTLWLKICSWTADMDLVFVFHLDWSYYIHYMWYCCFGGVGLTKYDEPEKLRFVWGSFVLTHLYLRLCERPMPFTQTIGDLRYDMMIWSDMMKNPCVCSRSTIIPLINHFTMTGPSLKRLG